MDKISQAIHDCLTHARSSDRPFIQVSGFLERLRSDPEWTDLEVNEVKNTVIRALMREPGSERQ